MDRRRFLTATAAGLAATALRAAPAPKEVLKLVSILPRAGSARGQTDGIVNGIRLAIQGHKGEAGGFKIELVDLDDADVSSQSWTPEAEEACARKAIADPAVMASVGPYNSGAARVSMPLFNEAGLVQVTPAATYPGLTRPFTKDDPDEPTRYRPAKVITFLRTCPTDDCVPRLAARFARDHLKAASAYVIDDKELYGIETAAGFQKTCEELKIKVAGTASIDPQQKNFAKQAAQVKAAAPDVVFFGGTTQSGGPQLVKELAAAGVTAALLLPDGCYEQSFLENAGADNLKNCYVAVGGIDPANLTGPGAKFERAYKDAYHSPPDAYAVYGYEAAGVILAAIDRVKKKDREAIRKAVAETKEYDGALGKWGFDANGDTTLQQATVYKIDKGAFVSFQVLTAK